ncbi:MiaB/RimO family radical SAM methylthiotransferase [Candidatus Gracilibacteria bacterium]|nr:MiaB/RimO family radical SAM methylthiotransferase [Candidatus Gracilibacteria bacterium]
MFAFSAINLGCSKNMVDLEFAIGEILKYSDRAPIEYIEDPESQETDYVIVNTCGFLSSARQESEETLSYYDNLGKKLILMGCYVSVKDDAFLAGLKNLVSIVPFMSYSVIEELVLGKKSKFNLSAIVKAKQAHKQSKEKTLSNYLASIEAPGKGKKAFVWRGDEVRAYMHAPFSYEYLKIAEGCDNNCTFCIIPTIRGRQTSRSIESIVKEVGVMLEQGIQEIQIISQDTTRYGTDLYEEPRLIELLQQIDATIDTYIAKNKPANAPTYRVYYLYPDILSLDHLSKLTELKHFLPYFDIPFQHASENILKLMGRHYDRAHIDSFIEYIRDHFPASFIRTSFIIGFPGETDADFQILLDFVSKYQFESVGIFEYHDEPLAASSKLPNKVDESIAKNRIKEITPVLNRVYDGKFTARKGKKQVGYIMDIKDSTVIVRPEMAAPEIDDYDEVFTSSIIGATRIGSKVEYILPIDASPHRDDTINRHD